LAQPAGCGRRGGNLTPRGGRNSPAEGGSGKGAGAGGGGFAGREDAARGQGFELRGGDERAAEVALVGEEARKAVHVHPGEALAAVLVTGLALTFYRPARRFYAVGSNPDAAVIAISATTGQGFDDWMGWLEQQCTAA